MISRENRMKWPTYEETSFLSYHVATFASEQKWLLSYVWSLLFTNIQTSVNAFGDFHPIILAFTACNLNYLLIPYNNIMKIFIK